LYDKNGSIIQASKSDVTVAAMTRYHMTAPAKPNFIEDLPKKDAVLRRNKYFTGRTAERGMRYISKRR